ncbi:MAG TPA: transposase [Rariglobus sp.]
MALRGQLAHLVPFEKQPVLFLTVCTAGRGRILANATVHETLRDIWVESHARQGWAVGDYVIMPDHVHLFARQATEGCALSKWMQAWKSIGARRIAERLKVESPVWQKDYFDRFLRSAESYSEKWDYVRMNPVRAGLVADAESWPWQGRVHDLRF